MKTRLITIITVLAVALLVPMAALAANFCAAPVDSAAVDFGATVASGNNIHRLYPEESTITKGGTVTFTIVGGGHRIAIYPVSMNTQRADIEPDLLQADGTGCVNKLTGCTTSDQYLVTDGSKKLVFDTGINSGANSFVGVDFAANNLGTAFTPGAQLQHTFYRTGRYMIICVNRGHFIQDYMLGFINVVNCDDLTDSN